MTINRSFIIGLPVLFVLFLSPSISAAILLNEFVAASSQSHETGEPLEWIELINTDSQPVNLQGYSLTDNDKNLAKWQFPAVTIPAHGFIVVYASGRDEPENLHTNFRLRRKGEYLAVIRPDGLIEDSIPFPEQRRDYSYGRNPEGITEWLYYEQPSFDQPNTIDGLPGFTDDLLFSHEAAVYPNEIQLALTHPRANTVIYYTMDGSVPDETSLIYTTPIPIQASTAIRARAYQDGLHPSVIKSKTFIVRENITLPIMTFITDPDHLFDRRRGIYIQSEQHGIEWERPVSVEYFTRDGQRQFIENAGVRIHGGASRSRSPMKSFRLYFRSEYGDTKLNYPLFTDSSVSEFNQLVIRGGFNDTWTYDREVQRETAIYVSDQVVRNLHLDMGQPASRGNFAELYINGEYWGLYNPCERIEEDMLQSNIKNTDWDVIADNEAKDGDNSEWVGLHCWLLRNDIAVPEHYAALQSMVDLENFTDYIILHLWMQNYDWPRHNWYTARERSEQGKWIFLAWDVEYSFGSGIQGYRIDQNTLENATDRSHTIGLLFSKLIENGDYTDYFWNRLNHHLDNTLSEEHILQRLEDQLEIVRPAIPAVAERWRVGKDITDWERAADLAREFIAMRTPVLLELLTRRIGSAPVHVKHWSIY